MIRCWIAAAVFAVVLAMPNRAEAQATANDEVLRLLVGRDGEPPAEIGEALAGLPNLEGAVGGDILLPGRIEAVLSP